MLIKIQDGWPAGMFGCVTGFERKGTRLVKRYAPAGAAAQALRPRFPTENEYRLRDGVIETRGYGCEWIRSQFAADELAGSFDVL